MFVKKLLSRACNLGAEKTSGLLCEALISEPLVAAPGVTFRSSIAVLFSALYYFQAAAWHCIAMAPNHETMEPANYN